MLPEDVKALLKTSQDYGMPLNVLNAVEEANEHQKRRLFEKLEAALNGKLRGSHIALWGLAFKPNTDDMREAPALTLIEGLLAAGATGGGARSRGDA
jgi:UDPglucose 6-dehydrogenase